MDSYSFVNVVQKTKQHPSHRGISMSMDWDKIVKKSMRSRGTRQIMIDRVLEDKANKVFCTGSTYSGQWDALGMSGKGLYTMMHGVVHEGHMKDGDYHGYGSLDFPNGSRMEGLFVNGRLISHDDYKFADGKMAGPYCSPPDRRFYREIENGIRPAGRSYLTNDLKARKIPNGMYDTVDGFYNPITKCVYNPYNLAEILRIPTKAEHDWILEHCRKAWDEPVGYRRNLYDWMQEEEKTDGQISVSIFDPSSRKEKDEDEMEADISIKIEIVKNLDENEEPSQSEI